MKKLFYAFALCAAFCVQAESISGQQSGVATSLRNQIRADHGPWLIRAQKDTSIDANDEVFLLGTNCRGENSTEPSLCYGLENDYGVTAQGSGSFVRSLETYMNFNAGHGGSGSRPFFYSFVPATSGDGYINYGYMSAGPNLLQTSGGGGWQVDSGTHGTGVNNEGTLKLGVDIEGVKAYNLQLFNDTYADPITTSNTTNMTVALPTGRGNEFSAGSLIGFYSKTGAGTPGYNTAPVATATVTSISTDTLTTNFNNSGTRIVTNAMVARKLSPPAFTSSTDCGAFGTTCNGTSQERVKIAGNMQQIGSYYINDVGATQSSVLNFNKNITNYQFMSWGNTSQGYAMGWLNGNNATMAIGPAQTTDSNFNSANSLLAISAGGGVGVGGTNTSNVAMLRVAGTDAARSSVWLNDQTDSSTSCFDAGTGVHLCSIGSALKLTPHNGQPKTIFGSGSTQRVVPTTGATITAAAANQKILAVPAGTIAALTVKFPASPVNEQVFEIISTQTITTLTLQNSDASALTALPTFSGGATAGVELKWFYSTTDAAWIRLQ